MIRQAGFTNVRVALVAFQYMNDNDQLDKRWLAWLDARVNAALGAGLTVIVDEHDSVFCSKDVETCSRQLKAFWTQIAQRYKNMPNRLIFELLNEPHTSMTPERWNAEFRDLLATIRVSNPTRNIMIGPAKWYALRQLPALELPADDRHIIVTFHYYEPFKFTHQAAFWIPLTKDIRGLRWGSDRDKAAVESDMNLVQAWAKLNGRPINLGEFGTYARESKLEDRVDWTSTVMHAAEARGFSWTYWDFEFDTDEVDPSALTKEWGGVAILQALGKKPAG
jgi:endoglucanase